MKKLLSTTAIAGLLISGSAFAQTSITGELRINLKSVAQDAATGSTTTASGRGFGTEQQINFANKGKLNVGGLDYAAGFSIENDGAQVGTLFNENMYIDITNASSGTTLSFSQDHIQRSDSDRSAAVIFGFSPNELSSGGASTLFDQTAGVGVGVAQSIAILQKVGNFGTFSYNYAPTMTNQVTTTTTSGVGSSETFTETDEESAYEIGFTGSLGVAGLDVALFKAKQKAMLSGATHAAVQPESDHIGIRYTTGAVSFGVAQKKYNQEGATKTENKEKHYGAAYAVDKNLSLGIIHATAERTGLASKQKTTGINIGYNLGPVALTAAVAKSEDVGGVNGADNKVFMTRFIGAF